MHWALESTTAVLVHPVTVGVFAGIHDVALEKVDLAHASSDDAGL